MQIGVVERQFQEFGIIVGKSLKQFLLLILAFATLFHHEDDDGEREADDGDDVAGQFPSLEIKKNHEMTVRDGRDGGKSSGLM